MNNQIVLIEGLTLVVMFVAWSGLLYLFSLLVRRFMPKLSNWSRFWLALCGLALVPLLPITLPQQSAIIPEVLKQAIVHSKAQWGATTQTLAKQSLAFEAVNIGLWSIVALILLGCGYGLWRFTAELRRVDRMVKQSDIQANFDAINPQQHAFIVDENIAVRRSGLSVSPFVYGFFKLHLMLPDYVQQLPPQQQVLLIEHELTHIKRMDPQVVIVLRLLVRLFWFNPFIRLFTQHFIDTMELNCDAQVIAQSPSQKSTYAKTLIASLKMSKSHGAVDLIPCFCARHNSANVFQLRIRSVMADAKTACYGPVFQMALTLVCSLFACFVVVAKSDLLQPAGQLGLFPVDSHRITARFDVVNDIRNRRPHRGIDIGAALGADVLASFSGTVLIADDISLHQNYGKVILIDNGSDRKTLYAHLDSFTVEAGQTVVAGQKLGQVGMTGRTTGPHLHFEVLAGDKHVDPEQYLTKP
ncbi:MAG: peptidoglycan DD-metalloendopeptidase family protein [Algicola sp.]|nr:peptidoglycan DD-metalloendopeptidase family protein [Algicola sp.]